MHRLWSLMIRLRDLMRGLDNLMLQRLDAR